MDIGRLFRAALPHETRVVAQAPEQAHISQLISSPGNFDCGPTSAAIALRLIGAELPGMRGLNDLAVIGAVRRVATGAANPYATTGMRDIARVFEQAGVPTQRLAGGHDVMRAVEDGRVVLVGGNTHAVGWRGNPAGIDQSWKGHMLVASNYRAPSDSLALNNPGDLRAFSVPAAQLRAFTADAYGQRAEGLVVG